MTDIQNQFNVMDLKGDRQMWYASSNLLLFIEEFKFEKSVIWGGSINKSCSKIQNPHFDNFLSNDETDKAVSVNTAPLQNWGETLEN